MNKNSKKYLFISIIVIFLGLLTTMGSFAYYSWNSSNNKKNVFFNTSKELSQYIVYDEGESKFIGDFKMTNNYYEGIHTTVSINKTEEANNVDLYATIYLRVNSIGINISDSTAVKWVLVDGDEESREVISSGSFYGVTENEEIGLKSFIEVTREIKKYTVWIWLDASENIIDEMIGETLDTSVYTQVDQMQTMEESRFEVTRITSNYQFINATVINNKNEIVGYNITKVNVEPSTFNDVGDNIFTCNAIGDTCNLENCVANDGTGTYYVWFKDSEGIVTSSTVRVNNMHTSGPVCTFGNFSESQIEYGEATQIELTCIDPLGIKNSDLSLEDIVISKNDVVSVNGITKTKISNGYKYTIEIESTNEYKSGRITLSLPVNKIQNKVNIGNNLISSQQVSVSNLVQLTVNPNSGTYNGSTNNTIVSKRVGETYSILEASKTGHENVTWKANHVENLTSQNNLATITNYTGSEYQALGRDYMYEDKINITILAYMDDWSDYTFESMRMISCTQAGGWNIEENSGKIRFAVFDKGVGYKYATSETNLSELSSGWHLFTATFDGYYARFYIDGNLEGTSELFESGLIGYYALNGIFIGGEAGLNQTTPDGSYFEGKIGFVSVENSVNVSGLQYEVGYDDDTLIATYQANVHSVTFNTGVLKDFEYSNGEEIYNVPLDGTYKLEVWGAQGGGEKGGYGGYSKGEISLSSNQNLYVNVGGRGGSNATVTNDGGYNGGGYSGNNTNANSYGGGGATHIALQSGVLSSLESYKGTIYQDNSTYNSNKILIVAGGGGGAASAIASSFGGSGGGIQGQGGASTNSTYNNSTYLPLGGSQTAGGFGYQNSTVRNGKFGSGVQANSSGWGGGGGAGFYGGGNGYGTTGAGGSGYIGSSLLTNKYMYCYQCTTSNNQNTLTYSTNEVSDIAEADKAKSLNGHARITYVLPDNSVEYNSSIGYLPEFTRYGYNFLGWYTEEVGGTRVTSDMPMPNNDITLYAHWEIGSYNLSINPKGGSYNGSTNITSLTKNFGETYSILNASKTGYEHATWRTNHPENLTSQNNLATITEYTGSEYQALGREYMYEDKFNITVLAYMDNWSDYATENMRMINCTENGGWTIEPSDGKIAFSAYDKGVGYKALLTSTYWSELSSGWHLFTVTFNGYFTRVYIDGEWKGTSSSFVSGKIGYNETNGIFIGTEAGSSATTPAGTNYFRGKIGFVSILHSPEISGLQYKMGGYDDELIATYQAKSYVLTFDYSDSHINNVISYGATNGEQAYPNNFGADYKLEVWGAQGGKGMKNGTSTNIGGYGGYSKGELTLNRNHTLYINVGKKGTDAKDQKAGGAGGYNGGGTGGQDNNYSSSGGNEPGSGGGGATHIAIVSGALSALSSYRGSLYADSSTYRSKGILIVAGGGGGGAYGGTGGHAGGFQSKAASNGASGHIATQTSGNAFGLGATGANSYTGGPGGGGGGFYGGKTGDNGVGGAGGSGYIGSSLLTNKYMYCYSCSPSDNVNTRTYSTTNTTSSTEADKAKTGDGVAKITIINLKKIVSYGEAIGDLPVPSTVASWNFSGWKDSNGNIITSDMIYSKLENTTYTASFEDFFQVNAAINGANLVCSVNASYSNISKVYFTKCDANGCDGYTDNGTTLSKTYSLSTSQSNQNYYCKAYAKLSDNTELDVVTSSNVYYSAAFSSSTVLCNSSNNTAYPLVYSGTCAISNGQVSFKSTGTLYVNSTGMVVDIFGVGGGGGGACSTPDTAQGGGGGGGGYTKTVTNKTLSSSTYAITIGSGGAGGTNSSINGKAGGSSSFGSLLSVNGGSGGIVYSGAPGPGGAGGSGGGAGGKYNQYRPRGGNGGSYGNNGNGNEHGSASGGTGQGTTTCSFGQGSLSSCNSGYTVYAGGGGGGQGNGNAEGPTVWAVGSKTSGGSGGGGQGGGCGAGTNGTANTGGGGGGGCGDAGWVSNGGAGGSGIVIIKVH